MAKTHRDARLLHGQRNGRGAQTDQGSHPKVAATQFTIYNSLSNPPVSFGAGLFATLGGTEEMTTVLWLAVALLFGGALLYGSMHAGSRHEAAPPVPKVD